MKNVLPNPPQWLCIHEYKPCIDLITHKSWQQCICCGKKL